MSVVVPIDSLRHIQDSGIEHAIVLIYSDHCGWCQAFKKEKDGNPPIYSSTASRFPEFSFFELPVDKMPKDEKVTVSKRCGEGVPLTIYMKDGKYVDSLKGYANKTEFADWLNKLSV